MTAARIYISNISPAWSVRRQETAFLMPYLKDSAVFLEELSAKQRRARKPETLIERAAMLRPTSRLGGVVHVASLAVLAWDENDFRTVLAALAERGGDLFVAGVSGPVPQGDDGVAAFLAAKRHAQQEAASAAGAAVSKEARRAASDARIALIKDRWPLPDADWPMAVLLAEAGLSRNTVVERLGPRRRVQFLYERAMSRRKAKK